MNLRKGKTIQIRKHPLAGQSQMPIRAPPARWLIWGKFNKGLDFMKMWGMKLTRGSLMPQDSQQWWHMPTPGPRATRVTVWRNATTMLWPDSQEKSQAKPHSCLISQLPRAAGPGSQLRQPPRHTRVKKGQRGAREAEQRCPSSSLAGLLWRSSPTLSFTAAPSASQERQGSTRSQGPRLEAQCCLLSGWWSWEDNFGVLSSLFFF